MLNLSIPRSRTLFGIKGKTLFTKGVDLFNAGKFWEAHETFEDLWRRQKGDVKRLVQGFVQSAAAFSYIERRRYESILYLFDKSVEKLAATSHLLPGVNIQHLVDSMKDAKEEVARLGETNLEKFDPSLYPSIKDTRPISRNRVKAKVKKTS